MACTIYLRINGKLSQPEDSKPTPSQPTGNQLFCSINQKLTLKQQTPAQTEESLNRLTNLSASDLTNNPQKLAESLADVIALLEFDCGAGNLPPLAHHIENLLLNNKQQPPEQIIDKLATIIEILNKCEKFCQQTIIGEQDIMVKRYFVASKHQRQQEYTAVIAELTQYCHAASKILQASAEDLLVGRSVVQLRDYALLCQGENKVNDGRSNFASAVREGLRSATDDLNTATVKVLQQNGPQNGAIAGGLATGIQLGAIYFTRKQGKFADFKNKLAKDLILLNYFQLLKHGHAHKYPKLTSSIKRSLKWRRGNHFKNSLLFKSIGNTRSIKKLKQLFKVYTSPQLDSPPTGETQPLLPSSPRTSLPGVAQSAIGLANGLSQQQVKQEEEIAAPLITPDVDFYSDDGMRLLARLEQPLQEIRAQLKKPIKLNLDQLQNNICAHLELHEKLKPEAATQLFFRLLHFSLSSGHDKASCRVKNSLRRQYATVLSHLFQTSQGREQLAHYFKFNHSENYTLLTNNPNPADFERIAIKLLANSSKTSYSTNLMLIIVALNGNLQLSAASKTKIRDYIVEIEKNPNFGHLYAKTNIHQANDLKTGVTTFLRYGLHNTPTMKQALGLADPLSPQQNLALQGARWGEWQLNVTANSSSHPLLPRTHTANTALTLLNTAAGLNFAERAPQPDQEIQLTKEEIFYTKYAKFTRQNGKWQPNIYHQLQQIIKTKPANHEAEVKQVLSDFMGQHPLANFTVKGITYQPYDSTSEFVLLAAQLPWGQDDALLSLAFLQAIILQDQTQNKAEKQQILQLILSGGLADTNSVVHHLTKHSANKSLAYNALGATLGAAIYALTIALIPVKGVALVACKFVGNFARMNLSNGEIVERAVNKIPRARPNRYRAPHALFKYCHKIINKNQQVELGDDLAAQEPENSQVEFDRFAHLTQELNNPNLSNDQRFDQLWHTVSIFANKQIDRKLAQQIAENIIEHPQLSIDSPLWQTFAGDAQKYRSLFFANFILAVKSKSLFAVCRHNKFSDKFNILLSSLTTLGPAMMTDLGVNDFLGLYGLGIDGAGGAATGLNNLAAQGNYKRTTSYRQIIGKCKQQLQLSCIATTWDTDSTEYKIVRQAFSVRRYNLKTRILRHPFKSLRYIFGPQMPKLKEIN